MGIPKRHQAPPQKNKPNGFETPKDILPSGLCLGWQTHTLPSRLHHDLTKGLRSFRVYRGQSDFAGGSKKKKTNGKQVSILTSNINLHEIIIMYTYHIISLHIYIMYI